MTVDDGRGVSLREQTRGLSGEELRLPPTGDLGERNAGLLVFATPDAPPEYVAWPEVARIDFDATATLPAP